MPIQVIFPANIKFDEWPHLELQEIRPLTNP